VQAGNLDGLRKIEESEARQALLWFHEQSSKLPTKQRMATRFGRAPRLRHFHRRVENPVYGGAYALVKRQRRWDMWKEPGVKSRRKARAELALPQACTHEAMSAGRGSKAIRTWSRIIMYRRAGIRCAKHGEAARGLIASPLRTPADVAIRRARIYSQLQLLARRAGPLLNQLNAWRPARRRRD